MALGTLVVVDGLGLLSSYVLSGEKCPESWRRGPARARGKSVGATPKTSPMAYTEGSPVRIHGIDEDEAAFHLDSQSSRGPRSSSNGGDGRWPISTISASINWTWVFIALLSVDPRLCGPASVLLHPGVGS